MQDRFTWLHLTDLHCGTSQDWMWPNVREIFFKNVRDLFERIGSWQLVVFSGDLTQAGRPTEFQTFTKELVALWEEFDRLGFKPLLVVTPGNHDLVRPDPVLPASIALKNWHDEQLVRESFWTDEQSPYRIFVRNCFQNYLNWFEDLRSANIPLPKESVFGILPGDTSTVIKHDAFRVGVIGLNSSFLQLGDGSYNGKLGMDLRQLHALTNGDPGRWCQQNTFNLLVTHHPPDWLHPDSRTVYEAEVSPPGRFFAHLFGHLHEGKSTSISEGGFAARRMIQGRSLFGLKMIASDRSDRSHGYSIGQVEITQSRACFRFWPNLAIRSSAGHLKLVPDHSMNIDSSGVLTEELDTLTFERMKESISDEVQSEGGPDSVAQTTSEAETAILKVMDGSLTVAEARQHLIGLPKFLLRSSPEYQDVRLPEQTTFRTAISEDRAVWLIADWGLGRDGFIEAALGSGADEPEKWIGKIDCEGLSTREKFLAAVEGQLEMSFQRFCSIVSVIPNAYLICENVGADAAWINEIEELTEAILEYCQHLSLILAGRTAPKAHRYKVVVLQPLDEADTKAYIELHRDGGPALADARTVEQLHRRSEGVPRNLDRFLRALKVFSLDQLSELDQGAYHSLEGEPIPGGLIRAFVTLRESDNKYTQRSYHLLTILSVLSHGETLARIRKFDPTEPFYPDNVEQLLDLGLIEAVPIRTEASQIFAPTFSSSEKKLIVPRQVRDYVRSQLDEDTESQIIAKAVDLYFGPKWRSGRVKVPDLPEGHVDEEAVTAVGNPHIVSYCLLRDAIRRQDTAEVKRAVGLAESYSIHLLNRHRYRTVCHVTGEILHLLGQSQVDVDASQLNKALGQSLRMLNRDTEAVDSLKRALSSPIAKRDKDFRGSILINLVWSLKDLNRDEEAVKIAEEILELFPADSHQSFDAKAVLFELSADEEATKHLQALERSARKKGFVVTANNIALFVAGRATPHEAEHCYRRVMDSRKDYYNRLRASFHYASLAIEHGKSINREDRLLLNQAYAYAYSQRVSGWFDSCHEALWEVLKRESNMSALVKLFRLSSFVWRIQGKQDKERKYLSELATDQSKELLNVQSITVERERVYLVVRIGRVLGRVLGVIGISER